MHRERQAKAYWQHRVNSKPRDFYPTVKKEIPWLVLVNLQGEPLVCYASLLRIRKDFINLGFILLFCNIGDDKTAASGNDRHPEPCAT
jgi:hypothetical protein